MKRKPKFYVRTRVDFIGVNVTRNVGYSLGDNGLMVIVQRIYGGPVTHYYHHVTDASLLRIARVGRAIGKAVKP